MKAFSKLWRCFREHIDEILIRVVLLLVALAAAVMLSESTANFLKELLGLHKKGKYEVLQTIGFCIVGVLLVLQALAANKRAKAMEDTAREQAKATKNTEEGQRQERLKNAIEHLGHKRDSVRMGGAYELFHLAEDTKKMRQTVLKILCAHIRQTTGEDKYKEKHRAKPSEEIQGQLTLLFVEEHNVFEDCSINLQGSYLNGATLIQARLKKANLKQAQLQEADLREAQLQEADLREAQLQKADLGEAQLQEADLREAQLQGAYLGDARLQRANLWWAQLQGAVLRRARLQKALLRSAKLQRAILVEAKLQEAILIEAKLQEAKLQEAQLQGANFYEARLQIANLSKAQMQGANLWQAQMQAADLSKAQMQGANLGLAQLQGADLIETQLQGVSSPDVYSFLPAWFESRINDRKGKDSDLTGIIFAGELKQEYLDALCEGLSAGQAQVLREKLGPQVRQPASHELPENSGAETGTYTQEEVKQWIAEYQEAMREVPKRDDS